MKSTGVVRRIDELGRIVLPIEIRKNLNIENRDTVEIFVEEDKIILKKYEPACIFCGNADDVIMFNSKLICRECVEKIKDAK
ncbi:MAG: AbrB/MazE/SpoVT family DNA-binding domain-containing protein [Clostridia bacterium]|nr:AbrB/MazE/SpoVT family DNA-binding domain-containing protein [Clostridia bacterium]